MSEYVISNEIVTLAVNLEDGSWRVLGQESRLGSKCFWYENETGELLASALGTVLLLERTGETADGREPIRFQIETPGQALDLGQSGTAQRVYVDVNTRDQVLTPHLVVDGGVVYPLPLVVQTTVREVVEIPAGSVNGRVFGVRLTGLLTKRVDLYEVAMDITVGQQEHQVSGGGGR